MNLLVLGASSDMGIALINHVVGKYDIILAHYHHMNDGLKRLKEEYNKKIVLLKADLSLEDDVEKLMGDIEGSGITPLHIVHFPAQQIKVQKFIYTSWDVFERGIDISIKSIVRTLQTLLPKMIKANHGRVVIILSDAVVGQPPKYSSDYVVTKYALLGLVKSLAIEYSDKGITVNGVSPGFTETKFVEGMADYFWEEQRNNSPLGRNLTPQDIIPTIVMLLSEDAACISGQNIPINFGR